MKQVSPAVVQLEPNGGVGSGVIFDKSGLILTAHHVVAGAEELNVKLADGTELQGRVVGRLPERDLAIVAVDAGKDLPAADLAGESTVEVGEPVVAIGSPFGISQTVTSGIVSGLDREIDSPVGKLTGLIQTDAPINPGNSGGPLIDADAKVIGINSAIASTSGPSSGVGFAVPVEDAKDMIDQVRQAGGSKAPSVPDTSSNATARRASTPTIPSAACIPRPRQRRPDRAAAAPPRRAAQRRPRRPRPDEPRRQRRERRRPGQRPGQQRPGQRQRHASPARPRADRLRRPALPATSQERSSAHDRRRAATPTTAPTRSSLSGPQGNVAIVATRGARTPAMAYDKLQGDETNVAGTTGKASATASPGWPTTTCSS